jgi:hypothetical protein
MLEGQNLSGQLSDWSINDLLQIMQVTKKTGSLDIEGDRRGRIHFVDGSVTGAELAGVKGNYRGTELSAIADILFVLSTLDAGSFGLGPADGPDGDGYAVEDIMAEVTSLSALEEEVSESGLLDATGVQLSAELKEPMTIEPDDWRGLVTLVQPFSFAYLESRVGRGGAVRALNTLIKLGVAEAFDPEDNESAFLERLADVVAGNDVDLTWLEPVEENGSPKHLASENLVEVGAENTEGQGDEDGRTDEPDDLVAATVDHSDVEAPLEEAPSTDVATDDMEPVAPRAAARGVAAPASTTLTDGVYDEIRRLRSKVSDGK